jgi:iron complex outermembrane receptor protein
MLRHSRSIGPTALAIATALAPLVAQAQEPEAGLEEVVVTAQRVETDIQKTPVAVTALTGDFLRDYDFRQVTSIEGAAPNLNFAASTGGASSQVSAFIRGVGEFDFLLTTDPAVGLYIDGVYLARTFGANLDLADVERVEVLRGPQGTLFGKNNIGGAINLITRKPEGSGRTDAELTGGSYNSWRASITSDIPLGDDVALLLSAAGRKSDGWQDRPGADGGEENRVGARAALRFTPSDTFESTLALDYVDQDQTNYPNNMVVYDPNASPFLGLFNGFVSPTNPCCTPNESIDESGVTEGLLPHDDLESLGVSWFNNWTLAGGSVLRSITAYRETEALFGRDGDNSGLDYNGDVHDEEHDQFSQEFQLASQGNESWNWIAGLYYFREETDDRTRLVTADGLFGGLSALEPIVDLNDLSNPLTQLFLARYALDFTIDFDNNQTTTDYAAYFHGDYSFAERWTAGFGLRYTNEEKEFHQTATRAASQTPLLIPVDPFTAQPILTPANLATPSDACSDLEADGSFRCEADWDDLSGEASLGVQWTDDIFAYGKYSRGFRSGGINGRPVQLSLVQDYDPEFLDSFEVGLKTLLADRRVRLNTAAFYNKYKDIQVLLIRGASVVIDNAAEATIYGLEVDFEAQPTDALFLRGSLGLMENEFDDWSDDTGDFTDRKLRNSPEMTANFLAAYTADLGGNGSLRPWAEVQYQDEMFLDGENTPELRTPSRTLVNAGIAWASPGDRWEVEAHVTNATDERVLDGGFNVLAFFGYMEGFYNPPRRYWLTLRYRSE